MILSGVFTKIQQLDRKIQILSEMTPGLNRGVNMSYETKTQKENRKVIMEKVNKLEKLASQLKVHTLDG